MAYDPHNWTYIDDYMQCIGHCDQRIYDTVEKQKQFDKNK